MSEVYNNERIKTVIVLNLAAIFARAEESILPAIYNYVSVDLNASPSEVGAISFSGVMTQALTSPVGGILGTFFNRATIITIGCFLWAIMTLCFGISRWVSNAYIFALFVWSINGFGLALMLPNAQSIIADYYDTMDRGKAFGFFYLNGGLGILFGIIYALNMSGISVNDAVIKGWQIVMFTCGGLSMIVAILVYVIAKDPRYFSSLNNYQRIESSENQIRENYERLKNGTRFLVESIKNVFSMWSFLIIIFQGIVGSMPWKGVSTYVILYFQLIGMTDLQATIVSGTFFIGHVSGLLFGGYFGDIMAKYSPNHGRIYVCQFSTFSGIPLSLVIFKYLPMDINTNTILLYCFVSLIFGFLISWGVTSCNAPIFADIVPENQRSMIYAFDLCLENALSSPVIYFIGLAAEKIWGFEGDATVTGNDDIDMKNANALKLAMIWFTTIPWTLCLIIYSALHFTYSYDKIKNHI